MTHSINGLVKFSRDLLAYNDLDPIYNLAYGADLDNNLLKKWLLAYWCFYHVGTASEVAVSKDYWHTMTLAASSSTYPRATERRHFRGQAAVNSIKFLSRNGIDNLFSAFDKRTDTRYSTAMSVVKRWVGFGDWIAFKVVDMSERLGLLSNLEQPVLSDIYESPKGMAQLLTNDSDPFKRIVTIVKKLKLGYAPPDFVRPIDGQEVETMLCKYKSFLNGKYHIGEDVQASKKHLTMFNNKLVKKLLEVHKQVF